MRIDQALRQVRAIQWQIARSETCYCYRSAAIAASGLLALAAAAAQPFWIPRPLETPQAFVAWWVAVAAIAVGATGAEMAVRWFYYDSHFARRQTVRALRQFAPCVIVGAAMTAGIVAFRPEHAVLLPALWAMVFSLGVFASCRHLPPAAVGVGVYYLAMGLLCLRFAQAETALGPWTMGIAFGIGQLLTAAALYRRSERLYEDA